MNKKYIPSGPYCYEYINGKFRLCPYWSSDQSKPPQENGHCLYLGVGDWECNHLSLLWDQCKECGENLEE